MNRTVVVHQPDFLPYLGFFHRFLTSDIYIALDHVQFVQKTSRAWTHRDKIKTRAGESWLSLSVKKCPIKTAIRDVELSSETSWRESNLNLLRESYRNTEFFDLMFAKLEKIYRMPFERMANFNMALIEMICECLGIRITTLYSSDMCAIGQKSELIANLVSMASGTRYMSGTGARSYHEQEPFDRRGIEVIWQVFKHPIYRQQFGEFIPYLSTIDALFNCGPEQTAKMLRSA